MRRFSKFKLLSSISVMLVVALLFSPVVAADQISPIYVPTGNGSATSGSVTNGSVTNGSATNGSATSGSVTNGSVTNESIIKGTVGKWVTGTSLPQSLADASSVTYNGYVYYIGGENGSLAVKSVYYASLRANGTVGAWNVGESLPKVLYSSASVVTANGYVYILSGANSSFKPQSTVYYAKLNSNGSVGKWTTTTSLPKALLFASAITSGNYVYFFGGLNASNRAQSTVYYAKLNSNGSVGKWTTTTSLPQVLADGSSVTYDGYVYYIAGANGDYGVSTVYYAKLNSNGSVGKWMTTSSLPLKQGLEAFSADTYNGYVYVMGGVSSQAQSTVYYAKLNSNGSVGKWTTTTSLPKSLVATGSVTYKGYVYIMGGLNADKVRSAVYYAPLNK